MLDSSETRNSVQDPGNIVQSGIERRSKAQLYPRVAR